MEEQVSFSANVERFAKPHLWDYHIKVPLDIADQFYKDKSRRVLCEINGQGSFKTGIMPDGNDIYFIKFSQDVRRKYKIKAGDKIKVILSPDHSKYGFDLPEEFEVIFAEDQQVYKYFEALTPGKQRALIYMIDKIKNLELRVTKSIIIMEHLNRLKGKLDFKILHEEFRNR